METGAQGAEPDSILDDVHPLQAARPQTSELDGDVMWDLQRAKVFGALFSQPVLRRFGRYIVLDVLGRGGMGTVLRGYDDELDRQVAIKVLHTDSSGQHGSRLRREAQALAKLAHPNVVQVHEVGEAEGQLFVVMELVKGQTLQQWQRAGESPRAWKECVEVYLQAGRGLAAAHAKGVVHRDFKPGNAILDEEGRARVLDFGLARVVDDDGESLDDMTVQPPPSRTDGDEARSDTPLTRTGAVLGTLAYMPPEQMMGEDADARSDQFSFCVSLYEALYGQRPFEGTTRMGLIVSTTGHDVRPVPKRSKVPATLRAVLLRGLAPEPADRWPSMDALLDELHRRVAPRARRWVARGLTAGLALLGGGLALGQYFEVRDRCTGASALLDDIWDEARKPEVEGAILGTELAFAPGTWERVEQRLDDYAEGWTGKHTEVCEATRVTEAQTEAVMELRMGCLEDRRVALKEAVDLLARITDEQLENAVTVVTALPSLARCDDMDALRAALPPPEDPAEAAEVEALRVRLVRARTLETAGAYDEALAEAEPVVQRASALEYRPLVAEALRARGRALNKLTRHEDSARDLEAAFVTATELGDHHEATLAISSLAYVVGSKLNQFESGLLWAKAGRALARRHCAVRTCEANVLVTTGLIQNASGKPDEALDLYREALALYRQTPGISDAKIAMVHGNMSIALHRRGELSGALEHVQRALRLEERAYGPMHPQIAKTKENAALILRNLGRQDDALEFQQDALRIKEATLDPQHRALAMAHLNLALTLQDLGRPDEALDHLRTALSIAEARPEEHALTLKKAHTNMAFLLEQMGRLDEARAHYERSLEIAQAAVGPDHPELAYPLAGLTSLALRRDDMSSARAHAQRGIALLEAAGMWPDLLAGLRWALAQALWPLPEERARSMALARQARDHYVERGGSVNTLLSRLEPVAAWIERREAGGAQE